MRLETLDRIPPQRVEDFSRLRGFGLVLAGIMTFSGSFKEIPPLGDLPVDFTLILTVGSFAVGVAYSILVKSLPLGRPLSVLFFFAVMVAVGSIVPVVTEYGELKFTRLYIVTLASLLPVWLLTRTHRDAHRFIRIMVVLGFMLCIYINFWGERQYGFGRLTTAEGTTISYGRAAGFILITVGAWLISSNKIARSKVLIAIGVAGFSTWTMMAIASKGPILGLAVGLMSMSLMQLRRMQVRASARLLGLFATLASGLAFAWFRIPTESRDRIFDQDDGSTGSRAKAWDFTWDGLTGSPNGNGWGHWASVAPLDITYPHNLFLEVWWEAGVVGLVAICVAHWIPIRNIDRIFSYNRFHSTAGIGIFIYWMMVSMVSGDVNDNKILFILMVVMSAPFVGNDPDKYGVVEHDEPAKENELDQRFVVDLIEKEREPVLVGAGSSSGSGSGIFNLGD